MESLLGKIVWYRNTVSQMHAAVVTRAWSDRCVNLAVFVEDGSKIVGYTSVLKGDGPCEWTRPPDENSKK